MMLDCVVHNYVILFGKNLQITRAIIIIIIIIVITHQKSKFSGNHLSNKNPEFFDLVDHKSLDFWAFNGPQIPL